MGIDSYSGFVWHLFKAVFSNRFYDGAQKKQSLYSTLQTGGLGQRLLIRLSACSKKWGAQCLSPPPLTCSPQPSSNGIPQLADCFQLLAGKIWIRNPFNNHSGLRKARWANCALYFIVEKMHSLRGWLDYTKDYTLLISHRIFLRWLHYSHVHWVFFLYPRCNGRVLWIQGQRGVQRMRLYHWKLVPGFVCKRKKGTFINHFQSTRSFQSVFFSWTLYFKD